MTLARVIDSALGKPPPRVHMRRLVLGPAAGWVRCTIGPVPWAVLEALAERAEPVGSRALSHCSVRDLAAVLGLANDTVALALRRLGEAGLLRHESNRKSNGRFGSGRYVLTLPPDVFDVTTVLERSSVPKPAAKSRARPSIGEQLALLAEA